MTGELGVAVQSKFLAVGAVVPWARAGVGAVATQAYANPAYGPEGLELLASGRSAEEAVGLLTQVDGDREHRQLGIVDAQGRSATHTGEKCFEWAGGFAGTHYAAQGNILVGRETVGAMVETFESTGDLRLADRLLNALTAAQEMGGDSRGQQSAALLVVQEGGGYGGHNDRATDLRVDEHPEPIKELRRLHELHGLYSGEVKPENVVRLEGEVREGAASSLRRLGYLAKDEEDIQEALGAFIRTENFEAREQEDGYVDLEVLRFLQSQG